MIDPHKAKYHNFYWETAFAAARQSTATRHQVGAVVVTPDGMISPGWNGMPSGLSNLCETSQFVPEEGRTRMKTRPEVIHAERNAIDKMTRQGIAVGGSVLFITRAPCFECAKAIHGLGLTGVYYVEPHDDESGLALLDEVGIPVRQSLIDPSLI